MTRWRLTSSSKPIKRCWPCSPTCLTNNYWGRPCQGAFYVLPHGRLVLSTKDHRALFYFFGTQRRARAGTRLGTANMCRPSLNHACFAGLFVCCAFCPSHRPSAIDTIARVSQEMYNTFSIRKIDDAPLITKEDFVENFYRLMTMRESSSRTSASLCSLQ